MKTLGSTNVLLAAAAAVLACTVTYAQAPAPARGQGPGGGQAPVGAGGGGRGRGGLPGATPEQTQAVLDMVGPLAPLAAAATAARTELATAANARNDVAVRAAVEKLREAELALATARAAAFAILQAGPNRLNAEQVAAFIQAGGTMPAGRGGGGAAGPAGAAGRGAAGATPGRGN